MLGLAQANFMFVEKLRSSSEEAGGGSFTSKPRFQGETGPAAACVKDIHFTDLG